MSPSGCPTTGCRALPAKDKQGSVCEIISAEASYEAVWPDTSFTSASDIHARQAAGRCPLSRGESRAPGQPPPAEPDATSTSATPDPTLLNTKNPEPDDSWQLSERSSSSSVARARWRRSTQYARRKARRLVLRRMFSDAMSTHSRVVALSAALAALLYWVEEDLLRDQAVEDFHGFQEATGSAGFAHFAKAMYTTEMIRVRIGYGDILIKTLLGRCICMLGCFLTIPANVVFTVKLVSFGDALLHRPLHRVLQLWGLHRWEQMLLALVYGSIAAAIMVMGAVVGWSLPQTDSCHKLEFIDALWGMWSTMSTSGHGNVTIAHLAGNRPLVLALVFAPMIDFGAALFEGFVLHLFLTITREVLPTWTL